MTTRFRAALILASAALCLRLDAAERLWTDTAPPATAPGERLIVPLAERVVRFDPAALRIALAGAPPEGADAAHPVLELPLPDGGTIRLLVEEAPVMAPALAVRYADIRTYRGREEGGAAWGRCDLTPAGFHAMIFTDRGTVFIDPYRRGDADHYAVYFRRDAPRPADGGPELQCPVPDPGMEAEIGRLVASGVSSIGEQLRTYRLAVAATGEYTTFHGGSVAAGLAAVVTAVNRVVGVYEKEVAVRMELVANNDLLIYTNSTTDPYTNSSGSTMLGQNQATIDAVIGSANYDIGHVFSTGGGGIAGLGVVCRTGNKARGVTGLSSPIGDPFYIDYVAHEIGHQFGANHTFNGTAGSCGGGNRSAANAYEPGSGSTIMAYAGICGTHDIQNFSDAYFHGRSIDEITAYTTAGSGNGCPVVTATGNAAPVVTLPPGGFVIPRSTPFALEGSAADANADPLTYCWEEFDLGPGGAPTAPSGTAPIFRSFLPAASPRRTFPRLSDILANTSTIGEILPSYGRVLTFRLTARDNRAGGGGVGKATMSFTVADSAGPFAVTSPNTGTARIGGTRLPVAWSTARTNEVPVSCDSVVIRLSTDGGQTFPLLLSAGTPNDGADTVTLPSGPVSAARIQVAALDNVFFDLSNASFPITALAAPVLVAPAQAVVLDPAGVTFVWRTVPGAASYSVQVSADSTLAGGFVLNDSLLTDTSAVLTNLDTARAFYWRVRAANGGGAGGWSVIRTFSTPGSPPPAPLSAGPADGTVIHEDSAVVRWRAGSPAVLAYVVEWSADSGFAVFTADTVGRDTVAVLRGLADSTRYFWRVRASNVLGWGGAGEVRSFATVFFVTACIPLEPAWNLLSIPVAVGPDSVHALFPGCGGGCAFRRIPGGGYEQVCVLEPGEAYWVKCATGVVCLRGVEIRRDSVSVEPGWNLIGTISTAVADSAVRSEPPGIIVSPVFGFTAAGYTRVTTLQPGRAYWIRVDRAGVLMLGPPEPQPQQKEIPR